MAGLLSFLNRASDMGFDTKTPVYHGPGTSSPITEFEPGRAGLTYFSENPDYSKGYASGGNPVGEYFLRKGKQFDTVANPKHKEQMIKLFNDRGGWKRKAEGDGYSSPKEFFSDVGGEGRNSYKYDERYDEDWEILDDPETDILGDLFNEGYESFRFQERRPSSEYPNGVVTQAVADPSRIRSVDAAFDPEKKDSGNILASGAPVAAGILGTGAALSPEEAEAGPIVAGARRILDPRFSQPVGGGTVRKGLIDPMETLGAEITPRDIDTGPSFQLSDFEGQPYIISQSDRSAAGGILDAVGGTQIDPVDLRGGRDFMFENPGMAWASDPTVVNSLLERATKLKTDYGQDPLLLPYTMAPTGIDFATMPLDTMINFARSNMSKTNIKKLDNQIKKIIPKWGGVANPTSNAIFRDSTGDQRKKVADVIDKQFKGAKGGLSMAEARALTSDANQYLSNDGSMVNIGRIDTSSPAIADSRHPTYKGGLPGEGVGTFQEPLDIRKFVANNGRVVTNKPNDIRAASMNPALTQGIIDEKLLRAQEGSIDPRLAAGLAAGSAAAPTIFDQLSAEGGVDDPSMYRADGSIKSKRGFLGPVINKITGGTMTEFSTDLGDGSDTQIPTMVLAQSPEAIEHMRNMPEGKGFNMQVPIEKQIVRVARREARKRIKDGKSQWYIDGEELDDLNSGGMGVRVPPDYSDEPYYNQTQPGILGPDPTFLDKTVGGLDFLANAAQGAIAPIANAPNTIIQALTSDRTNEQLKADRDARLAANDYQPRTDLGQQYTQQALQSVGGLIKYLQDQAEQSRIVNAAKNSRILQTIPNAYNQLPERGRIVGNALLDSFL